MLNFLYQTMSHLWFGLAVFLIIFFICSRTAFFQTTLFQQNYSLKTSYILSRFFVARHPQYLLVFIWRKLAYQHQFHLYYRSWSSQRSFNRFLYKSAHLCSLCFVYPYQSCSRERLLFPSRRATGRTFITLVQTKKELLPHAIGVSFIFASSHIILLALFCYPHTFTPSIEDCALQVMITTALGTGCFIGLIMDSYKQKDILEGLAAKIALNVTNSSISILQNGFDQNAAQKLRKASCKTSNPLTLSVLPLTISCLAAQPVNKNSHFLTTCRETWKHCYQKNFA